MASTRLKNPATGASVQSERRTLTWSGWIKKIGQGADQDIYTGRYTGSYFAHLAFDSDDKIRIRQYAGGSSAFFLKTTRVFRDPNAWYHIVMAVDTTQATSSNRIKLYVNGEQITTFDTETYPSQNLDTYWQMTGTDSYPSYLGWDGTYYFNGLMSDVYIIGGTAYPASTFGSTDATTGEWKPNANPTISYGTGVAGNAHLKFDDTSNFGKNSATGFTSNHWSVDNGTMTKTEDNPSNVFATLNPLYNPLGAVLSHGNTHGNAGGAHKIVCATIACGYPNAPSTAKFYWETKMEATDGRTVGLVKSNMPQNSTWFGTYIGSNTGGDGTIGYFIGTYVDANNSSWEYNGGSANTISVGFTAGDIMNHAYDASTGKYWQGKNGTWFTFGGGVGNPANGNYPIVTLNATDREHFIFPADSCYDGRWSWNFGNGYFKTTQISSEGTNASGIGKFEFDVPNGFTALSTNGLNL